MSLFDLIKLVASEKVPSVPSPVHHSEPLEAVFQAAVPSVLSVPSNESAIEQEDKNSFDWFGWIAEQCLLLPDDRYFIKHRLATIEDQYRGALARLYVQAWLRGEEGEPSIPKKTNAGRRAANMTLLPNTKNGAQHR